MSTLTFLLFSNQRWKCEMIVHFETMFDEQRSPFMLEKIYVCWWVYLQALIYNWGGYRDPLFYQRIMITSTVWNSWKIEGNNTKFGSTLNLVSRYLKIIYCLVHETKIKERKWKKTKLKNKMIVKLFWIRWKQNKMMEWINKHIIKWDKYSFNEFDK